MESIKRAIIIVLDGVGIGELPDAVNFGDVGSDTLGNLATAVGGLNLPNLEKLGLANIERLYGMNRQEKAPANFGKLGEKSPGKDSTTGHWELAGCILDFAFPVYPDGFPPEIIEAFKLKTGRDILGNKPASGTEIIKELGVEHLRSGSPIVYTSADSVFQIAAHEEVIPLEELYEMCRISREILTGEHRVSRVIARPFIGDSPENFHRTESRRDFSLKPPRKLLQHYVRDAGYPTVGIGKIDDLYAGEGWSIKIHTRNNKEGLEVLTEQINKVDSGLIMINLVDFDMLWGHRNNVHGFYRELKKFDAELVNILNLIGVGDLLILTADHGNDPTTPSTDHSREYVPILIYGHDIQQGINVGIRSSFADLGKSIANAFDLKKDDLDGESFWELIQKK